MNMLKIINLERIFTKEFDSKKDNGEMIPLWKDYIKETSIVPRYVYYTVMLPNTYKGPYQHKKRRGLFSIVSGKIRFIYQENNKFKELDIDADSQPKMIEIPTNLKYLLFGLGKKQAVIINICDYPWKPKDNETVIPDFSKYGGLKNEKRKSKRE